MAIRTTVTISGEDEALAAIDALSLDLMGVGHDLVDKIADWIVIVTKNNIYTRDLYVSGDLWDSVHKTDFEDIIVVSVDAPHAAPLERGSQPSPGRYVPDIDRRLVHPTRKVIKWGTENEIIEIENPLGMHPGNKAYRFFGDAVDEVMEFCNDQWLLENMRDPNFD